MSSISDFETLAAEYALGTLEGADLDRAIALELSDPVFRQDVLNWQMKLLPMIDAVQAELLPADLWSKIESQLGQQQSVAKTAARTELSILQRLFGDGAQSVSMSRRAVLATSIGTAIGGFGLAKWLTVPPEMPSQIAVLTTEAGAPTAVVSIYKSGIVELIPLQGIAVPDGRIIEVWTLQNRTQGPVSIGRMDQAKRLKLDLNALQKPETGHLFELTLEPPGGSPTGKPTGPILMKGLVQVGV